MTELKNLLLLILISTIFGCSNPTEISETDIPKKVNEFAKTYINNIHEGNIDTCLFVSGPEINTEKGKEFLINSYHNIKYFDAKSMKIVGCNITTFQGSKSFTNYLIDYEYNYGKFIYFNFNIQEEGRKLTVIGFDGQMLDKPMGEITKFTLSDKGILHYIVLLFLLIVPIFMMVTIVFMVKTPMKRKWLWIIGALTGIMSIHFNWTTGDFGFQFMTIKIIGLGFVKSGTVAPWIATFSIPIFSIIFWFKRQSFFVNAAFEKQYAEDKKEREELLRSGSD